MAKRRRSLRQDDNRVGKICIGIILIVFVAVMSVQINKVYQKDLEKIAQEEELMQLLQQERDRQEELKEYEEYIESQEYIEDQAREHGQQQGCHAAPQIMLSHVEFLLSALILASAVLIICPFPFPGKERNVNVL